MIARRVGQTVGVSMALKHVIDERRNASNVHGNASSNTPIEPHVLHYSVHDFDPNYGDLFKGFDDEEEVVVPPIQELARSIYLRVEEKEEAAHQQLLQKNEQVFGPLIGSLLTEVEEMEIQAIIEEAPGVKEGERPIEVLADIVNEGEAAKHEADEIVESLHSADDHPRDFLNAGDHLWKFVEHIEHIAVDIGEEVEDSTVGEMVRIAQAAKQGISLSKGAIDLEAQCEKLTADFSKVQTAETPDQKKIAVGQALSSVSKVLLTLDAGLKEGLVGRSGSGSHKELSAKLHRVAQAANEVTTLLKIKNVGDKAHIFIGEEDITADVDAIHDQSLGSLDKQHLDKILKAADMTLHAGGVVAGGAWGEKLFKAEERVKDLQSGIDMVVSEDGHIAPDTEAVMHIIENMAIKLKDSTGDETLASVIDIVKGTQDAMAVVKVGQELLPEFEELKASFDKAQTAKTAEEQVDAVKHASSAMSKVFTSLDRGLPKDPHSVGDLDTYHELHSKLHRLATSADAVEKLIDVQHINHQPHIFVGGEDITEDVAALSSGGMHLDKKHLDNILNAADMTLQTGAVVVGGKAKEPLLNMDKRVKGLRDLVQKAPDDQDMAKKPEAEVCSTGDMKGCITKEYVSAANQAYFTQTGVWPGFGNFRQPLWLAQHHQGQHPHPSTSSFTMSPGVARLWLGQHPYLSKSSLTMSPRGGVASQNQTQHFGVKPNVDAAA